MRADNSHAGLDHPDLVEEAEMIVSKHNGRVCHARKAFAPRREIFPAESTPPGRR